ncbi:MAG TPA: tyrosine-type recombinase/integrase [Niabella sp.]|nr:tyrosine-type recombinase/integrase [Niabella sp.]
MTTKTETERFILFLYGMKFNTRINIRKVKAATPQKLHLVCRWGGIKFVYPTPYNVSPKHWNNKAQSVRNVIDVPNKDIINSYLNAIKGEALRLYTLTTAQRKELTAADLKKGLDLWNGYTEKNEIRFFIDYLQKYIDESPQRKNPKTGRFIGRRTIQEYITTKKNLIEYEREIKQRMTFENINLSTLTGFYDFLASDSKDFALNNIAKHIDNFRQFLRAAQADGYKVSNEILDTNKFKAAREKSQNIYLNKSELKALSNLDLSAKPTLDRVRDLFLIGCYTGLRISDFKDIQPHEIKDDFLNIITKKTRQRVVIPITDDLRAIFKKYDEHAPKPISEQKLNKYIKEIAALAGINEETEKQQTRHGKIIAEIGEKWQFVTSHTARRSFATNAVKSGIPIALIMAVTGHTKEGTFWKYVKLSPMEYGEAMKRYLSDLKNN